MGRNEKPVVVVVSPLVALMEKQTGMGFVSTMSRIGSMAAPAVLILDEIMPALPSIIYGGSAVIAGLIAFLLPETLNIPLPDTVEDVEEKREKQNLKEQTQSESLALQDIKQDGGEYEENKSTQLHPLSENPVQIKE